MEDKQKQIEEMAKDLYRHICGKVKCQECNYNGDSEILSKYCDNYLRAKHLVEKGYRKIPKNAVVYTKEQVDKIFNDYAEYIKKTRKETAEKFAERLKELVAERNCNDDYDWEDVQVDGQIFIECIDEIAKEIIGERK